MHDCTATALPPALAARSVSAEWCTATLWHYIPNAFSTRESWSCTKWAQAHTKPQCAQGTRCDRWCSERHWQRHKLPIVLMTRRTKLKFAAAAVAECSLCIAMAAPLLLTWCSAFWQCVQRRVAPQDTHTHTSALTCQQQM